MTFTKAQAIAQLTKMAGGYQSSISSIETTLETDDALNAYASQMTVNPDEAKANLEKTLAYGKDAWQALAFALLACEALADAVEMRDETQFNFDLPIPPGFEGQN